MTPERARSWLELIWPTLERGGPVVSLVLLLFGAVQIWYLLGQLHRTQDMNMQLYRELTEAKNQHVALLEKYVHCGN